jgi:Rad3-related DNA helicase
MIINENLNIYFPLKLIPREQQLDALTFVKNTINSGRKYNLLQMPTGSGKSYFTVMFMNWYKNFINKAATFDIITNSKILQQQYLNDYQFMKNLSGKANYECAPYNTNCKIGMDICKTAGPHCKMECPYLSARDNWISAKVGLTNFHLFHTFSLFTPGAIQDRNSNVLIIDEAHDFEAVFCDYISTTLSAKSLKKYGFELTKIEEYDDQISRIKYIHDYINFIENKFIKDVKDKLSWLETAKTKSSKKQKIEYAKYIEHCETQISKFKYLSDEYEKDPKNWALDITRNDSDNMYSGIVLDAKPIWGHKYLKETIYKNYDHIIFMSGSLLDKEMFTYINGIHPKLTNYFEIDSNFPLKNRPLYYINGVGKMSYSQKYDTFEQQLKWIKKIIKKYPNKKGIIHCGTYEFSNWLEERLNEPRLLFHTPENREDILQEHIDNKIPSIIVSPSMVSGVDFQDDISRFQIILKIPFPYLGSEKIKQRMKTNKKWYNWKTVVDFIQMIGRSIRSKDDYADTYILDDSFSDVLRYNSHLIPKYITDAIKYINV